MKKLLALLLAMLLPFAALADAPADYSPGLGMTMDEFLTKYNAISAPLGSPYKKLEQPSKWTQFNNSNVAWFSPVNNSSAQIFLYSMDGDSFKRLDAGLDIIQIGVSKSEDVVDLISITARCAEIFASDILGFSLADMRVAQVIRYYYENGYKNGNTGYAYYSLNDDQTLVLGFFILDGWHYFQISTAEAMP